MSGEPEYAKKFLEDSIMEKKVVGTGVRLSEAAKPAVEACLKVASREADSKRAFFACLAEVFGALEAEARELANAYASTPAEEAARVVGEAVKSGGFALVLDGAGKTLGELAAPLLKACAASPRVAELGSAAAAFACAAELGALLRVRAEEMGGRG